MRIATAFRYDASITSLQSRQRDLIQTQEAMTNGKRINRPSDDPTGAARAERAFIAQQRIVSDQRMVDASRNALTLAESTLGHSVNLLQSARETLVEAGNGTYTAVERRAQVDHLRNLRSQLLALANQDDGAGGFVFAGQSALSQPFLDTPTGVVSTATPGQQQLSSRESMPTTLDGAAVWLSARTGNGVFVAEPDAANTGQGWINPGSVTDPSALTGGNYQVVFANNGTDTTFSVLLDGNPTALTDLPFKPSASIAVDGMTFAVSGKPADGDVFNITPSTADLSPFDALDRAIAVLSNPNAGSGALAQTVNNGLRDLDAVLRQFQSSRSGAGAALNRLEAVDNRNQDRDLWAKSLQSDAEDIDMVQAVSEFKNKESGYQAALQSYALVQRMSLFDYMK